MKRKVAGSVTSLQFFAKLRWLDGRPLLDTIEEYRREIFRKVLDTFSYNLVLAGRGKKNWKTADLVMAALFCVVVRRSVQGSDALILANDEGQAADDLALAKKLVEINPELRAEFEVLHKELRLRDGSGSIRILPARDVSGLHGKTYALVGFDEIHSYKDWAIFEALQPDPTRKALTWITSYDTLYNVPGVPLYDLKQLGRASEPGMLFSWYSGDYCTDPAFAELEPELRANPSIASWPQGAKYLQQQKRRLPTSKFRRLHLNLPGAPEGAFYDQGRVMAAIVPGRRSLPPEPSKKYFAFVDMSGGSSDEAVLAIGHAHNRTFVLDLVEPQAGKPPFNPRAAIKKFCPLLAAYNINAVWGDDYAGTTFKADFLEGRIVYRSPVPSASDLYEEFEPQLNAGEVELLDAGKLQEQFLTLVTRGAKVTHEHGAHDDWVNAVVGCARVVREAAGAIIWTEQMARAFEEGPAQRPNRLGNAGVFAQREPWGGMGERAYGQMRRQRGLW